MKPLLVDRDEDHRSWPSEMAQRPAAGQAVAHCSSFSTSAAAEFGKYERIEKIWHLVVKNYSDYDLSHRFRDPASFTESFRSAPITVNGTKRRKTQ
jgi:hypothetical protein